MMLVLLTIIAFNFEAGTLKLEKKDSFYITKLLDSVYIYDDTLEIRGKYGIYSENENVLFVGGEATLSTRRIRAFSDSLLIRNDGNIILFMGRCVIVQDMKDSLWADRVYVVKDTIYATDGVKGHFVTRSLYFFSDTMISYDSVYILKGRQVKMIREKPDTLEFSGRYIEISKDTMFSNMRPLIKTGKYTVEGDTMFYYESDSSGVFWGDVIISWDSGMARGDTGIFYLREGAIDSMILTGACNLEESGTDSDIKLDASVFRVFFVNDSLRELIAEQSKGVLRSKSNE